MSGLNIIFMKCPNCAASLEIIPGNTHGSCDYCGSGFMIPGQDAEPSKAEPSASPAPSAQARHSEKVDRAEKDLIRKFTKIVVKRFLKETGVDLNTDHIAMERIRSTISGELPELMNGQEVTLNIPFITADSRGPHHLETALSLANIKRN